MQLGSTLALSDGRLPNFLIIGATKCGTESLHRYLSDHPDVFMHPQKELRYFTAEHAWGRGLAWYRAQFAAAGGARAVGESSNSYTRHPVYRGVPGRIHQFLPDVRMIYLIRHPFKRIESHYRHRLVTGIEWRSPERALREDPGYIAASRYGHQLEQYHRSFRPDQLLTLRLEHLVSNPEPVLRRLCRFLDIAETTGAAFPMVNVTSKRAIAPAFLRYFARFPAARGHVKAASMAYRRAGLDRFAGRANEPAFTLSPQMNDELAVLFREDRDLLARFSGECFDDWDFDTHFLGGTILGPDEAMGATRS